MLNTIAERGLLPATGGVVIVGYSGGADSTALLHLLTRVQTELQIQVHAAHLHHGMRPEADADVQVCQAVCQQLGVPLHVERVDVPALAKQRKLSLEEAGRNARYAFFERLARQLNAVAVALAHTRDDQIETILINLLRGTGPRGLCGMPYKRDFIIRPLLDATREQTHRYCAEQNLPTVFDSTNLDPHQLRRRVRAELIPRLRDMSPAFEQHLLRLAEILAQEEAWWEEQVKSVLHTLLSSPLSVYGDGEQGQRRADAPPSPFTERGAGGGRSEIKEGRGVPTPAVASSSGEAGEVREQTSVGVRLQRVPFANLHPALQRRVLREWLRPYLGTLNLPPFEILEAIRNAALEAERASWQLSPTLRLTTDENALTLHHDTPEPTNYEYPVSLDSPLFVSEAGVWVEIRSTGVPARAELVQTDRDARIVGVEHRTGEDARATGELLRTGGDDRATGELLCTGGDARATGELSRTGGDARATGELLRTGEDARAPGELSRTSGDARATVVYLDADAIQGQLTVRNARKGERFQPLGMHAPKKLSDIFTDRKVPKAKRWRMPLLCDEAGVLWIPGYTIAERVKITPHTKRVLQATLYRNADEE